MMWQELHRPLTAIYQIRDGEWIDLTFMFYRMNGDVLEYMTVDGRVRAANLYNLYKVAPLDNYL